ncbi:MAG: phosphoribosyltransferase [Thermoprotei archaeon]|nr:MAG: phosphoribosyltransferase [Thermoprotei archaeon]
MVIILRIIYISWEKVIELCYKLANKIANSGYEPDAIVVVLRGGVLPALILSDYLGVEEFYAIRAKHWGIGDEVYKEPAILWVGGDLSNKRLLIVDEVVDTGKTLKRIVDEIKNRYRPIEIKTAVLHVKPTTTYLPDFYAEKINEWTWIFYPWSLIETLYTLSIKDTESSNPQEILNKVFTLTKELGIKVKDISLLENGIKNYLKKYLHKEKRSISRYKT